MITNNQQALALALELAITAPTKEDFQKVMPLVNDLKAQLTEDQAKVSNLIAIAQALTKQ